MASKTQYAKWCSLLIQGYDHMVDDIYDSLLEDGYIDVDQDWICDEY